MLSIDSPLTSLLGGALLTFPLLTGCSEDAPPPPEEESVAETPAAEPPAPAPVETPAEKRSPASQSTPPALAPALPAEKEPRLGFGVITEQPTWLPGSANEKHTFELRSAGSAPLVIEEIAGAAGCEVVGLETVTESEEVAPYALGTPIPFGGRIRVLTMVKPVESACQLTPRITVKSNDPRGNFRVDVVGAIDPYFRVEPRLLDFGQLKRGETAKVEARIEANDGRPVRLTVPEPPPHPGVGYELIPVAPDAEGKAIAWRLVARIAIDAAEGAFTGPVNVKSDATIPMPADRVGATPLVYETQLTINGEILGDFKCTPEHLSLGLIRAGKEVTRSLRLECHDPQFSLEKTPPTIRVAGLANPGTGEFDDWEYAECFHAGVRPVDGENAVDVLLHLGGLPSSANGTVRGTLLIELDHPRTKRIARVITGVCRGK